MRKSGNLKRIGAGMVGLAGLLNQGCATPEDTALLGIALSVLSHGAVDADQANALMAAGQGAQYYSRTQAIEGLGEREEEREPIGHIEGVWVDHNVPDNEGEDGMKIHTKFSIYNSKGKPALLLARFSRQGPSYAPELEDKDGKYRTLTGKVGVASDILRPGFENCIYNDVRMFIPYSQLEIEEKGRYNLQFKVELWGRTNRGDVVLDESNFIPFWIKNN